jgi:hypothetical protein
MRFCLQPEKSLGRETFVLGYADSQALNMTEGHPMR